MEFDLKIKTPDLGNMEIEIPCTNEKCKYKIKVKSKDIGKKTTVKCPKCKNEFTISG